MAIIKSINLVQNFCKEQNVFIEDVFYDVVKTNPLEENDNFTGFLLILSLDLDKFQDLQIEAHRIVENNSSADYSNWNGILTELEELLETV